METERPIDCKRKTTGQMGTTATYDIPNHSMKRCRRRRRRRGRERRRERREGEGEEEQRKEGREKMVRYKERMEKSEAESKRLSVIRVIRVHGIRLQIDKRQLPKESWRSLKYRFYTLVY